ncbi:MAG: coproporphyrinogen III oxidase [Alphaproteobacteria bacterium]|nr:coproporphyrinogen III oxidase [Alphaproteobacteria bacterium]
MTFGIYIHWPFCLSKCPYCDFNSHVAETIDHDRWARAYLREIEHFSRETSERTVTSVFFGGGTPSLMKPETVSLILDKIQRCWKISNDWEVTLEANPTSVEEAKFVDFRAAGVNRVSLGVQSLRAEDLKFLGRTHSPSQALAAIETAGTVFDRFSFDLIYARPNQSLSSWKEELGEALSLARGHLSLYQLTIEKATPFYLRHQRGEFRIPDPDPAADLYDLTQEIMEQAGYPAYEVSNHAKTGEESRHNLLYWRYGDYLGLGPGAHGRLTLGDTKWALRGHRSPDLWLSRVEEKGTGGHDPESVDRLSRLREAALMGMRIREGVPLARLAAEYGGDPLTVIDPKKLRHLEEEGLIESSSSDVLQATPQGLKCLNAVLGYLLRG